MKIIRNPYLPVKGYKAMFFMGILFLKSNAQIFDKLLNHEKIHSRQFVELMITGLLVALPFVYLVWWLPFIAPLIFYIWYVVEWIIHLIRFRNTHLAYRRICFEKEAYTHEADMSYLSNRKLFSFIKYIG